MVRNKDIRKALYRLKMDGKTPNEVINAIRDAMLKGTEDKKVFISTIKPAIKSGKINRSRFNIISNAYKTEFGNKLPLSFSQTGLIVDNIIGGKKLNAMKFVKDLTNFSLKDSKDVVDFLSKCV